ncbi:MAG: hypothetical protein H7832_04965 [Magnetococcus sp. DMHC-6]
MISVTIHCGTYKTGSSSIQNRAYMTRDWLSEHDWLYPLTGLALNEPYIGYRHKSLIYNFNDREIWDELVQKLIIEIKESGKKNILISAEGWSRPLTWPSLSELISCLRLAGIDSIRGIVYLRNRCDYARSVYREFTRRNGNAMPFGAYVRENAHMFDLRLVASELQNIFSGQLTLFRYENCQNVTDHLFSYLGIPKPLPIPELFVNKGLNTIEIEACRLLNAIRPRTYVKKFPGITKLCQDLGIEIDVNRYGEVFLPTTLACDANWKSDLVAITGWPESDVEALSLRPTSKPINVRKLSPILQVICRMWLREFKEQKRKLAAQAKASELTENAHIHVSE